MVECVVKWWLRAGLSFYSLLAPTPSFFFEKLGVNYGFTLHTRAHLDGTVIEHGRNSQQSNAVHFEDAF